MKREIDINKKYLFPKNLSEIDYGGCKIVISVDTARWVVFDNEYQYIFYSLLKDNTIKDALSKFTGDIEDAKSVIVQIEGKDFTNTHVAGCINPEQQVLHLYITNGCNLHCPHCYMYAGQSYSDELTTIEIKSILRSFKKCGGANITFSGGEISLRNDLIELVKYADSINLSVRLLTNGTLWKDTIIEQISPHINSIQISVDGYDETSNAKIRGNGNFIKSLKTIDSFINAGVKTEIAITPFYDDELDAHIQDYADFIIQLSNKYQGKPFAVKLANQMLEGREIKITPEQQAHYTQVINSIYSIYYQQDITDYSFIAAFSDNKIMNNCMFGELSIAANGDVYFCSRVTSNTAFANIRTTPFDKIMEMSIVAQNKSNIKNLKPCNECELMYICGGGCRIDYFPEFAMCNDILQLDTDKIEPRKCSYVEKEVFYQMMIKTNNKLLK